MAPEALARATQTELQRLGCLSGRVDGKWGSGSQRSLRAYADRQGVKLASLEPDEDLLGRLKGEKARVCPQVCRRGEEEKAGRCVKTIQSVTKDRNETPASRKSRERNSGTAALLTKPSDPNTVGYQCSFIRIGISNKKVCVPNGVNPVGVAFPNTTTSPGAMIEASCSRI